MMQHLMTKVSRRAFFSTSALYHNALSSSIVTKHTFSRISALQRKFESTHKVACPSNYVKWGSTGFCRTLSFATGFTPLKAKPLEEIIDIARAKNKSPEELADIWDDVCFYRQATITITPFLSSQLTIFVLLSESITTATKSAEWLNH